MDQRSINEILIPVIKFSFGVGMVTGLVSGYCLGRTRPAKNMYAYLKGVNR